MSKTRAAITGVAGYWRPRPGEGGVGATEGEGGPAIGWRGGTCGAHKPLKSPPPSGGGLPPEPPSLSRAAPRRPRGLGGVGRSGTVVRREVLTAPHGARQFHSLLYVAPSSAPVLAILHSASQGAFLTYACDHAQCRPPGRPWVGTADACVRRLRPLTPM